MGFFSGDGMAIDLGSSNTTIYLENEGIVLREPTSVLTVIDDRRSVLAVGGDAYAMQGRTGQQSERIMPVMDGAVTDCDLAALLMVALAEKATGRRKPMEKAQLVVSMSQGLTKVESEALKQSVRMTGAKRMILAKTPLAAALGAGLKVDQPRAAMVVVLGGSTTEIAVLSMGGIVAARSMRSGTFSMDEAIVRYLRRKKNIIIGVQTAEDLKCDIGSAQLPEEDTEPLVIEKEADEADAHGETVAGEAIEADAQEETKAAEDDVPQGERVLLKGRDAKTGKPTTVEITTRDIALALSESVQLLVDALRDAIMRVPAELASDIMDAGICLSGGGALLSGLAALLSTQTNVPVSVSDHPHEDVILGLGLLAGDERVLRVAIEAGSAEEM